MNRKVTANVRVLQISDTHLGAAKRQFLANWAPLPTGSRDRMPDVTIHTGDLTVDGADVDDDMRLCGELLRSLPGTVLAVPGNHDVGEAHHERQPVDASAPRPLAAQHRTRLVAARRRTVAADRHRLDAVRQRYRRRATPVRVAAIGACDGRRAQDRVVHAPARCSSMRRTSPIPATGRSSRRSARRYSISYASRRCARRHRAPAPLARRDRSTAAVMSGAPSSGFLVGPENQPDMPGEKWLGAVVYDFDGPKRLRPLRRSPGTCDAMDRRRAADVYPHAVRREVPASQQR